MDVTRTLDCHYVEENDLVSRYIAGKLPEEEAEAFEAHYFGCERCWSEVRAATEVRAAMEKPAGAPVVPLAERREGRRRRAAFSGRTLALAATLLIGAFAAVLVLRGSGGGSGMAALARASKGPRNIDARLSGPFVWAPLAPVYRSEDPNEAPAKIRAAAAEAEDRAKEDATAANLHAAGVGHLLVGEWDKAIEALEKAKEKDPKNSQILTDLAAAYLARGQRIDQPEDIAQAYEEIQGALKISPRHPPALFNRAAILEAQKFRDEAVDAWNRYLEVDATSPWAKEAERRRDQLEHPLGRWNDGRPQLEKAAAGGDRPTLRELVSQFPQQSRVLLEEEVLPRWAAAVHAGDTAAATAELGLAGAVAESLAAVHGDRLLLDSVATIEKASTEAARQRLAQGHRLYRDGIGLYRSNRGHEALPALRESRRLFEAGSSPFAGLASLGEASCLFYGNDPRGLAVAEQTVASAKDAHASLLSRAHWIRGMYLLANGSPWESLAAYRAALAHATRLGETESMAAANALIAENLEYLGDLDAAWRHRLIGLGLLDGLPAVRRAEALAGDLARAALARRSLEMSVLASERMASLAREEENSAALTDALTIRAEALLAGGNLAGSLASFDEAESRCARIADADLRQRRQADIDKGRAAALAASDPAAALPFVDRAADYFRRIGNRFELAEVMLAEGRIRRASDHGREARQDLLRGLEEFEQQREAIPDEDVRSEYFEAARSLLDELVAGEVSEGRPKQALALIERARGRTLRDALGIGSSVDAGGSIDELASALPADSVLIDYYVLPDRLLIWVFRAGSMSFVDHPVPASRIEALARSANRGADLSETLPALFQILIAPVSRHVAGANVLYIVPDSFLGAVPFAALQDQTGRYLIQSHAIAQTPGARIFVAARRRPSAPDSVLLVANPAFDRRSWPTLPSLSGAAAEADRVASVYARRTVLSDRLATPSRMLREAPRHQVVHVASHALENPASPRHAALLLSPEGTDLGLLYAHRLRREELDGVDTVVLAACRSASGNPSQLEGVQSLVQPFLAAGAGAVVANLWPVDDRASGELLVRFHQRLREGAGEAVALRDAQVEAIARNEKPSTWAGFNLTVRGL
jgi:CHAT domain-containing protein